MSTSASNSRAANGRDPGCYRSGLHASISTADFLRTCQVVAYRLKNEPLKAWVRAELDGYEDGADVPDYREVSLHLKGSFIQGFMSLSNQTVPVGVLPEVLQANAVRKRMSESVAELEALGRGAGANGLRTNCIPPETFGMIEIYQGATTLDLWCEISPQALLAIADRVRNRALTLLLELEAEDPNAAESVAGEPIIAPERVDQLVQNYIYGQNVAVAVGPGAVAQQAVIVPGDLGSLLEWARGVGIPEAALTKLPASIDQDGQSLGARTRQWAKDAAKAAAGVGRDVAVAVIEAEITKYLGIP